MLAAVALVLALLAYVTTGNGIAYSGGAELALVLCAGAVVVSLAFAAGLARGRVVRILLGCALAGCLIGAAIAAYFLETGLLLACLLLALLCWIAAGFQGARA